MPKNTPFELTHYSALKGKTVKAVVRDGAADPRDQVWGLQFDDGTIAWIMCDPEGNGPGFLDLQKGGAK